MAKYVFEAKVLALVVFTLIGKHPWISLILLNACQDFAQFLVTDTPDSVFCLPGDSPCTKSLIFYRRWFCGQVHSSISPDWEWRPPLVFPPAV